MSRLFKKGEHGQVILSDQAREMPLDALHEAMIEAGFEVSRTTAWRARKTGTFVPGYRNGAARTSPGHVGWVQLTPTERQAGPSEVARRFRVDSATARKAIERGWFAVTTANREKVQVPDGRLRTTAPRASSAKLVEPLVPPVISNAPDGRPVAELSVAEIVEAFGLSPARAAAARRRGDIRTRGWPLAKRRDLARRLGGEGGGISYVR